MKIVFTHEGNTVILTPVPQAFVARSLPQVADMTEQQYVEFIVNKDVPAGATNVRIIQDHEVPTDRSFRNAWKHDFSLDMDKAVEITKDRLREERQPLLEDLDVQFMRAQEQGLPTAEIVAEKQRLRDITTIPNASMTPEQLKAIKAGKP